MVRLFCSLPFSVGLFVNSNLYLLITYNGNCKKKSYVPYAVNNGPYICSKETAKVFFFFDVKKHQKLCLYQTKDYMN